MADRRAPARTPAPERTPGRPRASVPGARTRPRSAARSPRTGALLKACRATAVACSLTVLLAAGVSSCTYHDLTNGVKTSDALSVTQRNAPPALGNAVNLLLIGLDSRKDMNGNDLPDWVVQDELHAGGSSDIGGYNTNSLIVLHIPVGGGRVTAFSVPRDDYVETFNGDGTSQGMHKIKEAYGLAKAASMAGFEAKGLSGAALEQASREVGREATITTLQKFLGLRIDHFAEVNLIGFYDIAQVVQPITVCLKHATSDPAMEGQGSGAKFHAGYNQLNAAQALSFVRQRHNLTNGDLDRTHRQQAFIASVEYKLKQDGALGDVGRLQGLLDAVKKDVVIDDQWNILDFAQQAPNLTGGNITFNTLPIQGFATRGGESVNLVDPDQIRSIVQRLTSQTPAPSADSASAPAPAAPSAAASGPIVPAVVDVFNGSGTPGLAGSESRALAAAGWTPGAVGNSTASRGTVVRYGAGAAAAAAQIAARLGAGAPTGDSAVPAGHVEVILGAGSTPAAVDAPASAVPAAPAAAPTSDIPFQGPAVQAGGIPCVD